MVNLPEGDLGEYVDGFFEVRQAIIEYSARPYWEMEQAEVDALVGSNPLSDALFPAVMRVAEAEARNTARLRGMAIVSAVEWYAQEHGVYPETLDALAPGYLPSVPQDPFSGRPFPYFVDANGYTVYAAGGDRTDNDGTPGAPSDDGSDLIIHRPDTP
jgi:hypothetical protein